MPCYAFFRPIRQNLHPLNRLLLPSLRQGGGVVREIVADYLSEYSEFKNTLIFWMEMQGNAVDVYAEPSSRLSWIAFKCRIACSDETSAAARRVAHLPIWQNRSLIPEQ
jgi:hypothetical protein